MRKREGGQALILVLILLAIGTALVIPALQLTGTALKSTQIVLPRTRALYAADAAQEFILWKLLWDGLGKELMESADPNPSAHFAFDVCGAPVGVGVYMRAVAGVGGITLAGDDVIQPTKTVSPDTIPNDTTETVTYTIRLEQLSENTTQGLDAIYDILPKTLATTDYRTDSSYLSVDGGPWKSIPNPSIEEEGGQVRLKWPADYDPDTSANPFSSNSSDPNYFYGIRDFNVRQVKELRFKVDHEFKGDDKDSVLCNWVVLKVGDVTTVSGPQASLIVGSPARPEVCKTDGMIEVGKISDPEVIPPGVETDIEYTISMTSWYNEVQHIEQIIDYLPPGFSYITGSTGNLTTSEPLESFENLNGVDRWKLHWENLHESIAPEETLTLTFSANTTKNVSGSYYNEVMVLPAISAPAIFANIGVTDKEYFTGYSWNTGTVMVPAFDSSANATGVTINANMGLILEGISITSWQVD